MQVARSRQEMRRLAGALAAAAFGVPLTAQALARAAHLTGLQQEVVGLLMLQLVLGGAGYLGIRRMGRAGPPPGIRAVVRALASGLMRGPVLAAAQAAATLAVTTLAHAVRLGEAAVQLARQEQAALGRLLEASPPGWAAAVLVLLILGAPVSEELFFRGYFYRLLREFGHMAPVPSAALSGAAFAALHGYLVHFPALWLSGMLLAYWYERSGHLAVATGAHVGLNAFTLAASALGFVAAIS